MLNGTHYRARLTPEDLAHDIFVKISSNRTPFTPHTNSQEKRYIRRTITNAIRSLAKSRTPILEPKEKLAGRVDRTSREPERILSKKESIDRLREIVSNLPNPYREAIRMHLQEKSHAEITRELNIPPGTLGSQLSRGMTMIHQRITLAQQGEKHPRRVRRRRLT